MEDPIKFHLWAKLKAEKRAEALAFIRDQAVFQSEIELRKAVSQAVMNNTRMQISSAHGYSATQLLLGQAVAIFTEIALCQESYAPVATDSPAYCVEHNFHFGGCLGCHMCSGFYAA